MRKNNLNQQNLNNSSTPVKGRSVCEIKCSWKQNLFVTAKRISIESQRKRTNWRYGKQRRQRISTWYYGKNGFRESVNIFRGGKCFQDATSYEHHTQRKMLANHFLTNQTIQITLLFWRNKYIEKKKLNHLSKKNNSTSHKKISNVKANIKSAQFELMTDTKSTKNKTKKNNTENVQHEKKIMTHIDPKQSTYLQKKCWQCFY